MKASLPPYPPIDPAMPVVRSHLGEYLKHLEWAKHMLEKALIELPDIDSHWIRDRDHAALRRALYTRQSYLALLIHDLDARIAEANAILERHGQTR